MQVGPEGSPELGRLLDRHVAPAEPVFGVFAVTAHKGPPGWWLVAFLVAALFPPTLMIILALLAFALLLSPIFFAWLFFAQARFIAKAPPGGLGDLLIVQPARLTLLRGDRCDPKRGVYEVRKVEAMPMASIQGLDLSLEHHLEKGLARRAPHLHVKLATGSLRIEPFGGILHALANLPLDRLPPRFRDRLRPFDHLRGQLEAWSTQGASPLPGGERPAGGS